MTPAFRFRTFTGPADFEAMARIIAVAKREDGVERSDTVETIAKGYEHLHNCDIDRDLIFVEVDGEDVGYSRVWWEEQGEGEFVYLSFCFLDPAWRRQGIGQALLDWDLNRLRDIGRDHVGKKVFRAGVDDGEVGTKALLTKNGFVAATFGAEMARGIVGELPSAELPEGLEIRPVAEAHLRAIWEADVEAFRDHWGFRPQTENDYKAFLDHPYNDPSLWKVAWEGDRVVGQVRSYIDPEGNQEYGRLRGWTENISTMKEWRGRGVARVLICESMKVLRERGMEEVALGVHTENPTGAFQLYSSLGYEIQARWTFYEKPW
jgi:ribosomal protein S18 acetylase RimI-like enzyme